MHSRPRALDPDDVADALAVLRGCDPDPARAFAPKIERAFPEVRFERDGDRLAVHVDGRFWPSVRLATLETTRGLSTPMRQARSRARFVVDALARRRTTLERLAAALLEREDAYLCGDGDARMLVPLGGRDLARDLGCAESAVSRAIADRFAATPFGTIPLRALLARRPGTVDVTTAAARELVREILTASPSFTDEAVARALRLRGVRLARRTVTTYRGALGPRRAARDVHVESARRSRRRHHGHGGIVRGQAGRDRSEGRCRLARIHVHESSLEVA